MITCVKEHHQMHLGLDRSVVLLQVVLNPCLEHLEVFNLLIDFVIEVHAFHKVAKNESFCIHDLFLFETEHLLGLLHEHVIKVVSVLVIGQSVTEHALVLVNPKSDDMDDLSAVLVVGDAQALEDLADVTQVEGVV
jgi:hypothetical protein